MRSILDHIALAVAAEMQSVGPGTALRSMYSANAQVGTNSRSSRPVRGRRPNGYCWLEAEQSSIRALWVRIRVVHSCWRGNAAILYVLLRRNSVFGIFRKRFRGTAALKRPERAPRSGIRPLYAAQ